MLTVRLRQGCCKVTVSNLFLLGFYCNDDRVTIYNKDNIRDSATVYIIMYKLLSDM